MNKVLILVSLLALTAAALYGQAVYGPKTKIVVEHSGLDVSGGAEEVDHFEVKIIEKATDKVMLTLVLPKDPDTTDSKELALGNLVLALKSEYVFDLYAVDRVKNVSTPTRYSQSARFDSTPPAPPIRLRINGVVTLEPETP